jgi:hypothetical protein
LARIPLWRNHRGDIAREAGGPGVEIQLFADGAMIDKELNLTGPVVLYYADGLQFDVEGNLYAMANITNEVEVFSTQASSFTATAGPATMRSTSTPAPYSWAGCCS